ncbi:hypothetical protein [Solidesulfovibrio magneticus]|uniref:hypothetical protein n=1 Tax=Solidesulfovibrio magneticus TaxID=184917 RepID=UPI0005BC8270|nr:hypothetical protein [Solidesulfovibrio magneticus]
MNIEELESRLAKADYTDLERFFEETKQLGYDGVYDQERLQLFSRMENLFVDRAKALTTDAGVDDETKSRLRHLIILIRVWVEQNRGFEPVSRLSPEEGTHFSTAWDEAVLPSIKKKLAVLEAYEPKNDLQALERRADEIEIWKGQLEDILTRRGEVVACPEQNTGSQNASASVPDSSTGNSVIAAKAAAWEEISIIFVNDLAIEIHCGGKITNKTFDEIGFSDGRRKDEPNMSWLLLKQFANKRGELLPVKDISKNVSVLRKAIKSIFPHLPGDPIEYNQGRRAYIAAFAASSRIAPE